MRPPPLVLAIMGNCVLLTACGERAYDAGPVSESSIIEVTAVYDASSNRHLFQTSTDTVRAGWTTFRLTNASPVVHFVLLDHLPGERTSEQLLSEVSPVFQEAMNLIIEGKPEEAAANFANLPPWFGDIVFRGGPGFVSPGVTTEATLYLEPGNYVMECYIKTADGVFHWNLGMTQDLHVTEEVSDARPPANPTLQITVTDSTLLVDGKPTLGEHLVAVHFAEEEPGLIGKDVHVVRMDGASDVEDIVAWMDFNRVQGQMSTAADPAPATFLGGVHDMPFGNTAYFKLILEAGDYLWISEQPTDDATYQRFRVGAAPAPN
jgi:hypothetical protein